MDKELRRLLDDLYSEGYQCGLGTDKDAWISAYALAIKRILGGDPYTETLVFICYRAICAKDIPIMCSAVVPAPTNNITPKAITESSDTGDICESCEKNPASLEEKSCPHSQELSGGEGDDCNCCNDCRLQCARSI